MITIFTTCKPFRSHFAIIQENAIENWVRVVPKVKIIIFGNDYGTAKIAKIYKLEHIADVKTNDQDTPLLSDIFQKARKTSRTNLLCYVNADIILPPDLIRMIKKVPLKKFLLTGRRYNRGELDQPGALDYFVFPKNIDFKMPPFAVGRTAWDNWLIYKAKRLKIPVIDATEVITIVHQEHDYSHVGYNNVWHSKERKENLRLASEKRRPFNLINADYKLTSNGLARFDFSIFRLWRNFQVSPVVNPNLSFALWPAVLAIEFLIKVYRKLKNVYQNLNSYDLYH